VSTEGPYLREIPDTLSVFFTCNARSPRFRRLRIAVEKDLEVDVVLKKPGPDAAGVQFRPAWFSRFGERFLPLPVAFGRHPDAGVDGAAGGHGHAFQGSGPAQPSIPGGEIVVARYNEIAALLGGAKGRFGMFQGVEGQPVQAKRSEIHGGNGVPSMDTRPDVPGDESAGPAEEAVNGKVRILLPASYQGGLFPSQHGGDSVGLDAGKRRGGKDEDVGALAGGVHNGSPQRLPGAFVAGRNDAADVETSRLGKKKKCGEIPNGPQIEITVVVVPGLSPGHGASAQG